MNPPTIPPSAVHDWIESDPNLATLPVATRAILVSRSTALHIPPGTLVFDEHQPCVGWPLLHTGRIRVFKIAPSGRELPLYDLLPGESCVMSTGCLLGHSDYRARAITVLACEVLLIPKDQFDVLLGEPAFRDSVFAAFADRLTDMMTLVEEIAFQRLDQRLAGHLLGHGQVVIATHQQLADELGSVREIVTRLLNHFAGRGLVALGRGRIEILDPGALRRLSCGN